MVVRAALLLIHTISFLFCTVLAVVAMPLETVVGVLMFWVFAVSDPWLLFPREDFPTDDKVANAVTLHPRARPHCRFVLRIAHPLHTRFSKIFGASIAEATMRPDPR
jgi:hypothetical protein